MPEINPDFSLQSAQIGNEKNALLIIDNFAGAPAELRELATTGPAFSAQASDFYPGLRKPVTGHYPAACLTALEPLLKNRFKIPGHAKMELSLCAFSLTTTPPGQLRPIQSIPHIDTHDPNQFALVQYLCDPEFGGTSLYRHRTTGFESITQPRLQDYFRLVKQEVMAEHRREFTYINGSTALFERIARVEARFNRAVIYRSNQLHSADINSQGGLPADPRRGRLTLNAFFRFTL